MKPLISIVIALLFFSFSCPVYAGLLNVWLSGEAEREMKVQPTESIKMFNSVKEADTTQQSYWYSKPHSLLFGELGGNFNSLPLSINYEYAFIASTWFNVFVRAGLGGNLALRMINTGTMLGASLGGKNSFEVNAGVIGDLYYNVPDVYGGYERGLKPVAGVYYRYYGENTLFRVGLTFIYMPNRTTTYGVENRPILYIPGISYGFMF